MIRQSLATLFAAVLLFAQNPTADIQQKIRDEATKNSAVMETMHYLSDVYGPRLTGSPHFEAAAKWAQAQFTSWGLQNAHLEPWDFGHPGWENERIAVYMLAPSRETLVARALAWTPSTKGRVRGSVMRLPYKQLRSQEEIDAYLAEWKGKVAGKIVLTGPWNNLSVDFNPRPKRLADAEVKRRFDPANPQPPGPKPPAEAKPATGTPPKTRFEEQLAEFLVKGKALIQITSSPLPHGLIRAFNNRSFDVTKALPTAVIRHEDFGRIQRLLDHQQAVQLEVEIVNKTYPAGKTAYNVVAEIPGSDKKDELVMLGGHLDSWHSATGATDNGIGCAMMMEAVRIIEALKLQPHRTIRIALWSGEEEGLLGSKAYVKEHFGTFEQPGPEAAHLVAYFNIDSGTGRPRGMSVFGPPAAAAVLRAILEPFQDLGVAGAIATRSRAFGGSDHTSFTAAGWPGIGIGQDPIEYFGQTWHTNVDTYERIVPEDAQKAAIVIADAVYELASRAERLPQFTKADMPEPPKPPATTPPAKPTPGSNQ